MVQGSASVHIALPPAEVFAAVADVTRMGDWSPENTGGRWVDGATGPAEGASFEGDNIAKLGPLTLKQWTTTSVVTECRAGEVFEFVTADYTTWRFETKASDGGTQLTESFSYPGYSGKDRILYAMVGRGRAIQKGVEKTVGRIKAVLEA